MKETLQLLRCLQWQRLLDNLLPADSPPMCIMGQDVEQDGHVTTEVYERSIHPARFAEHPIVIQDSYSFVTLSRWCLQQHLLGKQFDRCMCLFGLTLI